MRVETALCLILSSLALAGPDDFVNLARTDFSIRQDIRYATANNFAKQVVYPEAKCLLRKNVAAALSKVQTSLRLQGFGLKVYDCYRPLSVQKRFWEIMPDERYVADPKKGSRHNRGAAVDVTLVNAAGDEIEMPSAYDDFSEKAHRNYARASRFAKRNSRILEKAMMKEGFVPFDTEWWHFDFPGWEAYPIEDFPFSEIP